MSGSRSTLALTALLLVSLAVLATLQYHWIDQVSRAEGRRLEASLAAAADRFADDFDRELARALHTFLLRPLPPPAEVEDRLAERWRRWREGAPYPELVNTLWLADQGGGGTARLRRLDPETGGFAPADWPAELEPVRRWLEDGRRPAVPGPPGSPPPVLLDAAPALVVPSPAAGRTWPQASLTVIGLDRDVLTAIFLPELADRYFTAGAAGLAFDFAVVSKTDPGRIVYRSDPELPLDRYLPGVAGADLFAVRPFHELAFGPAAAGADDLAAAPPGPRGPGFGRFPRRSMHEAHHGPSRWGEARWRLVVSHRAGSLEAAVAAARRHNLGLGLGVLAVLAGSVVVLAASARRAQRLARQQLEFVAGVTHELHTPLAAICSAGDNLADGVVTDAAQVRRYGAMIGGAGRRLTNLVAQVLELAGMQSGHQPYRFEQVAIGDVLAGALADCRWEIEERGVAAERRLASDLPPVEGDPVALRRAFQNLIANAVKHGCGGDGGGWIGLRAEATGGAGEHQVTVAVEDRGPGIDRRDLPHLFEPFYRGRAAAGAVAGNGLGLAVVKRIVEAHGGRVEVAARAEGGSRFTVRLPAAATPGAEDDEAGGPDRPGASGGAGEEEGSTP